MSLGDIQKSLIIAAMVLALTYFGLIMRAPVSPLAGVSVSPGRVTGGSAAEGRITLNAPAPVGGLLVALESGLATVRVPVTVSVPEGHTAAAFSIQTWVVAREQGVAITAALKGNRTTTTLTVTPGGANPPATRQDTSRAGSAK